MKQLLVILLFIPFLHLNSNGQTFTARDKDGGDPFEYQLMVDDPNEVNPWYIGFDLAGVEIGSAAAMGVGLDLNYFFNNRIWIKGNVFRPFFWGTDSERGDYYRDEEERGYTIPLYLRQDFSATYYFHSASKRLEQRKVILKVVSGLNEKTVYVLETPIYRTARLGVRGGYYGFRQSVKSGFYPDTTADGWAVTLTGFTSHSAYLGLVFSTFQNLEIESERYGLSRRSHIRHLYLDGFYGLGSKQYFMAYDAVSQELAAYDYQRSVQLQNFGFRIGWERINRHIKKDHLGIRMGADIGVRPIPLLNSMEHLSGFPVPTLTPVIFTFKFGILFTGD